MADFILEQSLSFLTFFCCGICAAAIFDLFRILRRLLPHNHHAIALEDIFFCLICGITVFYLLFQFQSGKLRLFLPIAFFLGVLSWLISFSRLFLGPVLRFLLFFKKKITNILKE